MFEKTFFIYVLVAIFSLKPTNQQYQRSVPSCSSSGQRYCWSCTTASTCVSSLGTLKQYNTTCSGTTPMCGLDSSSPPKYACTSNAVADCTCTGNGLSYKKDPYNDQWYTVCSGTTATYIDCGAGKYYNEVTHSCGTTPPTTTTTTTQAPSICSTSGPGIYDDPNTCDSYYVCTSSTAEPTLSTCQVPNNYFDPEVNYCVSPTPHFQCAADQIGAFGDPFDCRRYYVCFDTELLEVGCCPIDQIFIAEIENCRADPIPDGCPMSDKCAQGFTTISTSTSTSTSTFTSSSSTSTLTSASTPSSTVSPSTSTQPSTAPSSTSTPPITSAQTSTSTPPSSSAPPSTSTLPSTAPPSTSTPLSTSEPPSTSTPLSSSAPPITSTLPSTAPPSTSTPLSTSEAPSTSAPPSTPTPSTTPTPPTTTVAPSCIPHSSYICPAVDGFYPQCNYCAKTYFQCVSGSATLGSCPGSTVFNTVPTYSSCISAEYCPYYP